jgi:hypothetical protein
MSKHTPASLWKVVENGNAAVVFETRMYPVGRTFDETQANARLIAAAPDMLEYLKACLAISGGRTSFDKYLPNGLADLIAKAEGRE